MRLEFVSGPTLDLLMRGDGRVELELPPGQRTFKRVGGPELERSVEAETEPLSLVIVARPGAVPLHIQLPLSEKGSALTFSEPIGIDLLRFGVDRSGREAGPAFHSGILKGSLRMLDTGNEITLRPHEPLLFTGLQGVIHFTKVASDRISLEFAGTTRHLVVGSPGFEENLTPTILEYLASQEALKLLWGALVVVVGGLLGVGKW